MVQQQASRGGALHARVGRVCVRPSWQNAKERARTWWRSWVRVRCEPRRAWCVSSRGLGQGWCTVKKKSVESAAVAPPPSTAVAGALGCVETPSSLLALSKVWTECLSDDMNLPVPQQPVLQQAQGIPQTMPTSALGASRAEVAKKVERIRKRTTQSCACSAASSSASCALSRTKPTQ